MAGEVAQDSWLTLQEKGRQGLVECIDQFHSALEIQPRTNKEVNVLFEVMQLKILTADAEEVIAEWAMQLTSFYNEISGDELKFEIPRLKRHFKSLRIDLIDVKN